MCLYPS